MADRCDWCGNWLDQQIAYWEDSQGNRVGAFCSLKCQTEAEKEEFKGQRHPPNLSGCLAIPILFAMCGGLGYWLGGSWLMWGFIVLLGVGYATGIVKYRPGPK